MQNYTTRGIVENPVFEQGKIPGEKFLDSPSLVSQHCYIAYREIRRILNENTVVTQRDIAGSCSTRIHAAKNNACPGIVEESIILHGNIRGPFQQNPVSKVERDIVGGEESLTAAPAAKTAAGIVHYSIVAHVYE